MAQFQFNINSVEKRENNFELLPAGWYTAQVTESNIAPIKSGTGTMLKLTFTVLQQGYNGRKVWGQLCVRHENPKTEKIANEQLRELCESVGLVNMQDTVELHNKPVQIKVKVRVSDNPQYEDQNEVVGFKPVGAGAPAAAPSFPPQRAATPHAAAPSAAPAAAAPAAAPAGNTPPWAKRAA